MMYTSRPASRATEAIFESSEAAAFFESLSFTVLTAIQRCLIDSSESSFPLIIAMLGGPQVSKGRTEQSGAVSGVTQINETAGTQLLTDLRPKRVQHEMLKGAVEQSQS